MPTPARVPAREGAPFGDRAPDHVEAVAVGEARQGRDEPEARDSFADALDGSSTFDDVRVARDPGAIAIASDGRVTVHVRLDVLLAEAP